MTRSTSVLALHLDQDIAWTLARSITDHAGADWSAVDDGFILAVTFRVVLERAQRDGDFLWWMSKRLSYARRPLRMSGKGPVVRVPVSRKFARSLELHSSAWCCSVSDLCTWLLWDIFLSGADYP